MFGYAIVVSFRRYVLVELRALAISAELVRVDFGVKQTKTVNKTNRKHRHRRSWLKLVAILVLMRELMGELMRELVRELVRLLRLIRELRLL